MNFDKLFDKNYSYLPRREDAFDLQSYLEKKKGWVYIAVNPGYSHFKIGRTSKNPLERAKTLSSAGVVDDYQIVFALDFFNQVIAEKNVHKALSKYRVSDKKEFFQTTQNVVVAAIEAEYKKENLLLSRFFNTEAVKEDLSVLAHYLIVPKALKK